MDTTPTQPQALSHIGTTSKVRGCVCSRAGCGKPLLGNDGRPIYDRNFCSAECRRADKRERMEGWRQRRIGSDEDHSTTKGNYKTDLTLTGLLMEGLGVSSGFDYAVTVRK